VCPLHKTCEAYQSQRVGEFPVRAKKRKPLPVRQTYLLIFQDLDGRFLLERRKSSGIWGGLWCFPCVDSLDEVRQIFGETQGFFCEEPVYLSAFRHSFTHFHLDVQAMTIRLKKNPKKCLPSQCWQSVDAPLPGGIPAPVRLLLDAYFIEEV
jgi:A/G-specific adenine glycosylase